MNTYIFGFILIVVLVLFGKEVITHIMGLFESKKLSAKMKEINEKSGKVVNHKPETQNIYINTSKRGRREV